MSPLLIGTCATACGVAGLLLPRAAYRFAVPFGEPLRDICVNCGASLPLGTRGWLSVRSTCPTCAARLGPATWATGVTAGLAGGLVAAALGPVAVLPLFLAVAVLGVLLAAIDIACRRLPDTLVLPALAVTPVLFAAVAAVTGQWGDWLRALLACLASGVVFIGMALLPGGGYGMGDAKVAALLSWYFGWLGWQAVLLGALLPWLLNAPLLLALLVSGRVGWKSHLPFGPALLAGGLLAVCVAAW
ncbi:A24 family peptidase [Micromonospora yasonensis]|uniref:prepilin peptidase n=1 Tax=Micromonospora yasonensis TaxID=1128667 RepID=UPI002231DEB8|nr:A24 family peptidase [Micromonospora yasonensis]MCW3843791.1 A24 family peptidase [Micromonospora yasonensis]